MRLINADALDYEVMHFFMTITGNPKQSTVVNECKRSFRNMIDEQPTVETAPKWIPCSERLPDEPEENPVFENKRLELYLVSVKYTDYPFRAFWNGKFFTEGWSKLENVIAWMPLPEPYKLN